MADSSLKLASTAIQEESAYDLAFKAFEQVVAALDEMPGDEQSNVLSLPQHWRAIYTATILDMEVKNGGFHQFFWNTEGKLNEVTMQDLEFLRATEVHKLFGRAAAIYSGHDYINEKESGGNTWERFATAFRVGYQEERFEELDNEYFEYELDINELIGRFIKQHPRLYSSASG
jgi:hypothetical protein